MTTLNIQTAKELKKLIEDNRENVKSVNDIEAGMYAVKIKITNKYVMYYNIENQQSEVINAPYKVILRK